MKYIKNLLSIIMSFFGFIKPHSEEISEIYREKDIAVFVTRYGEFTLQSIYFHQQISRKFNQKWIPDLDISVFSTKTSVYKNDIISAPFSKSLNNFTYIRHRYHALFWALLPYSWLRYIVMNNQENLIDSGILEWCYSCDGDKFTPAYHKRVL